MKSKLDLLREVTVVVADTGDIAAVRRHAPQDCTTNPSIVLKALASSDFAELFAAAVAAGRNKPDAIQAIAADLTATVGATLASLIPGRISTEIDADLSFDTEKSIRKAHTVIEDYARRGIDKSRVLVKLASTWEGIAAAKRLEREGINCNLTLLFSLTQAKVCADAGIYLISPFVGRITDWYAKSTGQSFTAENDPGVQSVKKIYNYYKSHGIKTVVMGASFRTTGQIEQLAGCDRLTIAPTLLEQLSESAGPLPRVLSPGKIIPSPASSTSEAAYRWELSEDAMATEKLAEGIRSFHADTLRLHRMIGETISRQ